jgi:transcriptional regulator GlxA family with amidase domain
MKRSLIALALLAGACGLIGDTPMSQAKPVAPKSGKIPVAFVLTEGATVIDFAGPWEVFQDVMIPKWGPDEMPFEIYTVGESRTPITATGGLKITPDYTFADAPAPKVVVIGAQRGSDHLRGWLQKVAADPNTDLVMSVCTGAFKLAGAGLLDGKAATTHHDFTDRLESQFPKVRVQRGLRYVKSDDRTYTAGGLTSGIDLALHVVSLYFGEPVAARTAQYMEYQSTGWHAAAP